MAPHPMYPPYDSKAWLYARASANRCTIRGQNAYSQKIFVCALTGKYAYAYGAGIGDKSMPSTQVSLASLLGQTGPDQRPIPEAQVATLVEAFQRYSGPCPFKAGDLVTPRAGLGYSDVGLPHIVLEVADEPHRSFTPGDTVTVYSCAYGSRLDVRVANFAKTGDVVTFWQESWRLEPWTGENRP